MDCPEKDCVLRTGEKCSHWLMFRFPEGERREMEKQWDCAFNWGVRMQYESLRFLEGNQAAVESFRNEMVAQGNASLRVLAASPRLRLENEGG